MARDHHPHSNHKEPGAHRVRYLDQTHTAGQWQNQNQNSGFLSHTQLQSPSCCFSEKAAEAEGGDSCPHPSPSPLGRFSDSPIEDRVSPHAIDDDSSGWAQQQGGHDDNGGQDDEDNDPDVQNVLGERNIHRYLADSIHVASP